ncbi:MAG TPA: NAD(P)/FAD-dependent oxidoreductase [Paracoccaceae bacterium]|nr:NAD(P)/FAD-dependent oxidoreductase [Paracoccaceae bacterium]
MKTEVLVLGAGAAGMMCAIEAARRGRHVMVLDHARTAGEKIRISGGGRCNFTNRAVAAERFLSANPRFALSALRRFTPQDFIGRVDRAGIAWHEKTLGQLFCDGSARQIVDMLLGDMADAGATLRLGCAVQSVAHDGMFQVVTDQGTISADSLVVATGGRSIPKMGATGLGYQIAEGFGLPLRPTRPGLVPLTFSEQDLAAWKHLAGLSVTARVSHGKTGFTEGMLFTHRGLSGPSILQISSYWREGDQIVVDLAYGQPVLQALKDGRTTVGRQSLTRALARHLPEKLAATIVERSGLTGNLADQPNAALERLAGQVQAWPVRPLGSEGYRTAEVTLGGVDTDALDARTMQARALPGLFFIGEVVDVTGWLGGYNFQWAWSSGWAAGQVA